MENASKALIIAGAVLIAILLISLTLIIIKNANPVIKQTEQVGATIEVHTFNSQFLPYTGKQVRGSQVRNLCDVVSANNSSSSNTISLIYGSNTCVTAGDITSKIRNNVSISKKYKVEVPTAATEKGYTDERLH